jgi:protein-tyrosine phosphatase
MAAALFARHLAEHRVDACVRSAGTRPWEVGATEHTVTVMQELGLDVSAHANRQLVVDELVGADLVIGMTRDHISIARRRCPDAADRVFLVGELARLARDVGPRQQEESPREWVERVAASRPANRPYGRGADEIDDPVGYGIDTYRFTAGRLDRDLQTVAALLAGGTA